MINNFLRFLSRAYFRAKLSVPYLVTHLNAIHRRKYLYAWYMNLKYLLGLNSSRMNLGSDANLQT